MTLEELANQITVAFASVPSPPPWCLVGSTEGEEPLLVEREFRGKTDWRVLDPVFLDNAPDGLASALSFFSDEAFRFYLPAYLIADLHGQLERVDVLFHLTHGLDDAAKAELLNPLRYGARTWFDAARYRLSTLDGIQCSAIVAYLEWKLASDLASFERIGIEQALRNFWWPRAVHRMSL
jgi:hypothetical protein